MRKYISNTIKGIAQADAALIVVDGGSRNAFEEGMATWQSGQFQE